MARYKIIKVTETKISRTNRVTTKIWYRIIVEKKISFFSKSYTWDVTWEDNLESLEEAELIIETERLLQNNEVLTEVIKVYDI